MEDVELAAEPAAREVLVKLMASGVCHSDWHLLKGEWGNALFPAILGHEGAGVVEAVGSEVTRLKPGDHVILSWRTSCGICEMCQRGYPALCMELTGGLGVHFAFEAIGLVPEPFLWSVLCTRRRGVTIWVGHAPLNTPVTIDARALMQEKTIVASMYGSARPHIDFPRLLNLYRDGKLKLDELITRRFALSEVNEAFEVLRRGEVARSVLNLEAIA